MLENFAEKSQAVNCLIVQRMKDIYDFDFSGYDH